MRFVPNFKILGQVVNEKSLTKISIFILYIGVRDRKKKNRKKNANKISAPWICFQYTLGHPYPVHKLKTLALLNAELI